MDETYVLEKRNKMMDIGQKVEKIKDVIKSCENEPQLRVAVKMFNHLLLNHSKEVEKEEFHKMKNLIGLMKKKCLETDEVNEEMSKIGLEFRKAAASSGNQDLNKIKFDEDKDSKPIKEISIGTQIEQNHLPLKDAKDLATQNVNNISDYYTDPKFCVIAVESKNGEKKTVRVEKDIYEKSKEGEEQLLLADMEIFHENLDMNDITNSLRNQLKQKNTKKFSKDEIFKEIKRRRDIELSKREEEKENWASLMDDAEEEIEEATGTAGSSGQYTGLFSTEPISRTIKKGDIPVSVNGLDKPIGKMYSLIGEDEELGEAVDYAGAVGSYETPAMWAKNKSNWRGAHKLTYPGGKFVNIKKKCKTFPYCNQGAGSVTLSDTSDMKIDNVFNLGENKIVKKKNLKVKK